MTPQQNYPLTQLNTLGFAAQAEYFCAVHSASELEQALAFANEKSLEVLLLGGGSNLVLRDSIPGLVVQLALHGRERVTGARAGYQRVRIAAGENWHETVCWCADQGLYGLENMALIPGSVGAAPVQNIGAYGVELKDYFCSLQAWDRYTDESVELDHQACEFGYRDSLFKRQGKNRYVILSVTLELKCQFQPDLSYPALRGEQAPESARALIERVCSIRRSKLPDPARLGNAGSFFKNPVVSELECRRLLSLYPELVSYPAPGGCKLAAGWLIDQCGLKGYRHASVGVHDKQALVLVNHGEGDADQLLELEALVKDRVQARFGVELEREPNLYPL